MCRCVSLCLLGVLYCFLLCCYEGHSLERKWGLGGWVVARRQTFLWAWIQHAFQENHTHWLTVGRGGYGLAFYDSVTGGRYEFLTPQNGDSRKQTCWYYRMTSDPQRTTRTRPCGLMHCTIIALHVMLHWWYSWLWGCRPTILGGKKLEKQLTSCLFPSFISEIGELYEKARLLGSSKFEWACMEITIAPRHSH